LGTASQNISSLMGPLFVLSWLALVRCMERRKGYVVPSRTFLCGFTVRQRQHGVRVLRCSGPRRRQRAPRLILPLGPETPGSASPTGSARGKARVIQSSCFINQTPITQGKLSSCPERTRLPTNRLLPRLTCTIPFFDHAVPVAVVLPPSRRLSNVNKASIYIISNHAQHLPQATRSLTAQPHTYACHPHTAHSHSNTP
jgi:hypothetical protein